MCVMNIRPYRKFHSFQQRVKNYNLKSFGSPIAFATLKSSQGRDLRTLPMNSQAMWKPTQKTKNA